MKGLFFGPAERQLYGVLHVPAGQPRPVGVVLCHPLPFEYMRKRWQHRKAADMLADRGFATLRFDWSGTGDSAGDGLPRSLASWAEDVAIAASELSELAEVQRVCVAAVGGAAMIAAHASRAKAPDSLLLVDPPLRGGPYLATYAHRRPFERHAADEILGIRVPLALRSELGALDLAAAKPRAGKILVLATQGPGAARELSAALQGAEGALVVREAPDAADPRPSDLEEALLSIALPEALSRYAAEELA